MDNWGPGYTDGTEVWVREETLVKMISDNPAFGNYIYNELVTYRGNWADCERCGPSICGRQCHLQHHE